MLLCCVSLSVICPTPPASSTANSRFILNMSTAGAGRSEEGSELVWPFLNQGRSWTHHSCPVLVRAVPLMAPLPPIPTLLRCDCGLGLCWTPSTGIISPWVMEPAGTWETATRWSCCSFQSVFEFYGCSAVFGVLLLLYVWTAQRLDQREEFISCSNNSGWNLIDWKEVISVLRARLSIEPCFPVCTPLEIWKGLFWKLPCRELHIHSFLQMPYITFPCHTVVMLLCFFSFIFHVTH